MSIFERFKSYLNSSNELSYFKPDVFIEVSRIGNHINSWLGNDYNYHISIGENCNSSWYLKETGIKKASYPFDWVFSSPDIIIDCIKDDFNKFLDTKLIIDRETKAGHNYYHDNLFNHRNPLRSDDDLSYYARCVGRFMNAIHLNEPILYICTVVNESNKRPDFSNGFNRSFVLPKNQKIADFEDLITLLRSKNPLSRFVFIEQYTEQKQSLELIFENNHALWIKFNASGKNNGVRYLDIFDDTIMKMIYSSLK